LLVFYDKFEQDIEQFSPLGKAWVFPYLGGGPSLSDRSAYLQKAGKLSPQMNIGCLIPEQHDQMRSRSNQLIFRKKRNALKPLHAYIKFKSMYIEYLMIRHSWAMSKKLHGCRVKTGNHILVRLLSGVKLNSIDLVFGLSYEASARTSRSCMVGTC
jgi:hypothetical protein